MNCEYKDPSLLDEKFFEKFDKANTSKLVCGNPNADQIIELMHAFNEFLPKDVQAEDINNGSSVNVFNKQFIYNFVTLILDRLEYALLKDFQSDETYKEPCFTELSELCLYNLRHLAQNQFDEFNFNPFLMIISMCYYDDINRELALRLFPVSYIVYDFGPYIKSNIEKYGHNLIRYFFAVCSFPHSAEESQMIFIEVNNIKDILTDIYSIQYICSIIYKIYCNGTLPIELFKEVKFEDYLTNLIQSNNLNIIQNVLLLIGKTLYDRICLFEKVTWDFVLNLLFVNYQNEKIFSLIVWILEFCIDTEKSNTLIVSFIFDQIIDLYPKLSINSKIQLSSFVAFMLYFTDLHYEEYLTYDVLDLIVDSFSIGDKLVVDKMIVILEDVIVTLSNPNEEMVDLELILAHLFENDILGELEHLRESNDFADMYDMIDRLYLLLQSFLQ